LEMGEGLSVVNPELDASGSKIFCLGGSGSKNASISAALQTAFAPLINQTFVKLSDFYESIVLKRVCCKYGNFLK
jgi:hypothetical protein